MSIYTIIGIPFIHELSMKLRLILTHQFLAHEIKTSFPVKQKETVLTTVDSVSDTTVVDSMGTDLEITNPTKTLGTSSVMNDPYGRSSSQQHQIDSYHRWLPDNPGVQTMHSTCCLCLAQEL